MNSNLSRLVFALLTVSVFSVASFAETAAPALPVQVVQPHPVDVTYTAEAVVEAVRQATVAAQIAGRVLEVRVDAGQRVKKGEVLMRIDSREASENVAAAQAQLINAKAAYERTQKLVAQKFISAAALDKAKSDYDAALAATGASRAGESHGTVTAPMSGLIAARLTEQGEMAAPGKPLLTIYDPSELRVTAQVPQAELAKLKASHRARIEFKDSGNSIEAAGLQIFPTVDAATHTATVRATLPATLPAGLVEAVPGSFVRIHFVVGAAVKLTVPASALVRRGEVAAVYVLTPAQQLSLRQLRLGSVMGDGSLEVLAGLAAGEQVVTDPVRAAIAVRQKNR